MRDWNGLMGNGRSSNSGHLWSMMFALDEWIDPHHASLAMREGIFCTLHDVTTLERYARNNN